MQGYSPLPCEHTGLPEFAQVASTNARPVSRWSEKRDFGATLWRGVRIDQTLWCDGFDASTPTNFNHHVIKSPVWVTNKSSSPPANIVKEKYKVTCRNAR